MFSANKREYIDAFKRCFKVIQAICKLTGQTVNLAEHRFQLVSDSPQQAFGTLDCGVFCVFYLLYKIDRDESIFRKSSSQMRYTLNDILQNFPDSRNFGKASESSEASETSESEIEIDFEFKDLHRKNKIKFSLIHFTEI